jgi:hypothetical protein
MARKYIGSRNVDTRGHRHNSVNNHLYMISLRKVSALESWNEFTGTPLEVPLYVSVMGPAYWDTREANNYREHIREDNLAIAVTSMVQRLNRHLKMIRTLSRYAARFTIWPHHYIQTSQIGQDIDNFIYPILLKQQQNGLKTNQTKGV